MRVLRTCWGLGVVLLLLGCTRPATVAPASTITPAVVPPTRTLVPPTSTSTAVPPTATPSVTPTASLTPTATPSPPPAPSPPPVYTYRVLQTYPHDPAAYTQGLVWDEGVVYEGTGLNGRSSLRRVDLESGMVLQMIELAPQYFGEGITVFDERIIQLTWRSNIGFVYDKTSFELQQSFAYTHEGWGITHDGSRLIVSDGTATLHFWDPNTLTEIGRLTVFDEQGPVMRLNELEYVDGEVWANIWLTWRIARIDLETGQVVGWIDLTGLPPAETLSEPIDVLNGIMHDAGNDRLFITGKLWPALYEIELIPPD